MHTLSLQLQAAAHTQACKLNSMHGPGRRRQAPLLYPGTAGTLLHPGMHRRYLKARACKNWKAEIIRACEDQHSMMK